MLKIDGKLWVSADYPHIRIPKRMLCEQRYHMLSPEALIVYAAMMDRTNLSNKNQDRFKNNKNEIYIYYPQNEIMSLLGCRHDKASKVLRELVDAELIKVRRRGVGRPYEIVLIPKDWRSVRENKNEQSGKSQQDSEITDYSLCGKADTNNTYLNNSESNNSNHYLRNYLKHEIGYDELTRKHDPNLINRILDIAVNTIVQDTETIMVGDKMIPAEILKERLRELKEKDILFVIRKIKNATYTTDHSDTFILNALYESTTQRNDKER